MAGEVSVTLHDCSECAGKCECCTQVSQAGEEGAWAICGERQGRRLRGMIGVRGCHEGQEK